MQNPVRYIRTEILQMTQEELAELLGIRQASVSVMETKGEFPTRHLPTIRNAAIAKIGEDWQDEYLWSVPSNI